MIIKGTLTLLALIGAVGANAYSFVFTEEHVDVFDVGYTAASGWELSTHDHGADLEYEPGDSLVYAGESSRVTNPGVPFLLGGAGSTMWWLRDVPFTGQPFAGVATEEVESGSFDTYAESDGRISAVGGNLTSNWVRLDILGISTPTGGSMAIWSNSFGGLVVWATTLDGISTQDRLFLPSGAHQHFNWGFSSTGAYEVTIQASAMRNGVRTYSDPATYHFGVEAVPEPASLLALGLGSVLALRRRVRR